MTKIAPLLPDSPGRPEGNVAVLSLEDVSIGLTRVGQAPLTLVSHVDLRVGAGEAVAIVGESGSGKSLTALSCLRLLPEGIELTSGSVAVGGRDLGSLAPEELRQVRGSQISMIFQDPMTSMDPCFSIGSQIMESILAHEAMGRTEARRLAVDMLGRVGIPDPARRFDSYPHEFSGGMRQRAMIAGALVLDPKVLIADEPTTALDVTTQAAIIALVQDLREELGMSLVWISHDLGVVAQVADRVAVMYAGELVEVTSTEVLFAEPAHPYTEGLIKSSRPGDLGTPFGYIPGSVPEPADWAPGCRFAERCARRVAQCLEPQPLRLVTPEHAHRCAVPLGKEDRT